LTEAREEDRPAAAPAEWAPLSDPEFKDQLAAVIPAGVNVPTPGPLHGVADGVKFAAGLSSS
jgi:hypothetical protein